VLSIAGPPSDCISRRLVVHPRVRWGQEQNAPGELLQVVVFTIAGKVLGVDILKVRRS